MDRFDVLIVGAGPAGSFAAELLARAGVSVALFDGRPPGEPKACGGGVTSKALKAWPHLLEAVGRTIDELDMYSPSGKHLHLKLEEPFAVYSRITFDTFLRERARKAGAKVFAEKVSGRGFKRIAGKVAEEASINPVATAPGSDPDGGWSVSTLSGAEFHAKYLVGADGANSAIAKKLAGPYRPPRWKLRLDIARRCQSLLRLQPWWRFCLSGSVTRGPFRASIMCRSASPPRRMLLIMKSWIR